MERGYIKKKNPLPGNFHWAALLTDMLDMHCDWVGNSAGSRGWN
ncbi:MAG TPA: hypothetical protein VND64_19345 [Pirellulales bacterium]|nr:hypothetical protein [Pirellulales bacterium]